MSESLQVDCIVAWMPIISGRRYVRELRLTTTEVSGEHAAVMPACCYVAGVVLPESLLADISRLNPEGAPQCRKVIVIDRQDRPIAAAYADKLRTQSVDVDYVAVEDAAVMLDFATEEAGVALQSIDLICQKLHSLDKDSGPQQGLPIATVSATWLIAGVRITERHLRITDAGLSAIETVPADAGSGITLLFLNTGSEKHVGPGRAWVEFARTLAARGHRSLRVDFQGWGESPDNGHRPGRPYDIHGVSDTRKIADELRARGHAHIVLVGVCAGAWIALRDCQSLPVQGIVAFNPQLYYETTDPDLPNMKVTRAWYKEECVKESWPERRSVVREWMQRINALTYPVDFWFEQGDPGIYYLEQELPDMLTALGRHSMLSVNMLPGLDHSMHRHWLRHEALEAIEHLIARMKASG